MKSVFRGHKGEGYIDLCVGVVAFVAILVMAINIFQFISVRIELDRIADELITAATYSGEFGEDYWFRHADMISRCDFTQEHGAPKYFHQALQKVQLGDKMWVTVHKQVYLKGFGVFRIPVTVTVTRSGLSEKYWK